MTWQQNILFLIVNKSTSKISGWTFIAIIIIKSVLFHPQSLSSYEPCLQTTYEDEVNVTSAQPSWSIGKTETWLSLAQPPKSYEFNTHGKAVEVPLLFCSSQAVQRELWWQQLIDMGWTPAPGVLVWGGSTFRLGCLELSFMALPLCLWDMDCQIMSQDKLDPD